MLTLDYRPKRFADVVGQSHVTSVLQAIAQKEKPDVSTIMLAGGHGSGKTSAARIFAAALNCENPQNGDSCAESDTCISIAKGTSDVLVEVDAATHSTTDAVQNIRSMCAYGTTGKVRVVLLDEAHGFTAPAQNALLKLLEEPPSNTVFVLLTTHPDGISRPVVSRAMVFEVRPVRTDLLTQRLAYVANDIGFECEPQLLVRIAEDSKGHVREAIMSLDQCRLVGVTTVQAYEDKFGKVNVTIPLLDAVTRGQLNEALDWTKKFFESCSDMKVLSAQLTDALLAVAEAVAGAPAESNVIAVAQRVTRESVMSALHVVWDFSGRVQWAPDDRSLADLVTVMLGKVLTPTAISSYTVTSESTEIPMISSSDENKSFDARAFLLESGFTE